MATVPNLTREDIAADLQFMEQVGAYEPAIEAARAHGIIPAIFLALASRESRGGRLIAGRGWTSDGGHGHSIFQVDDRSWPSFTRRVDPSDHARYARFAAGYLADLFNQFGRWDLALAAYNAGPDDAEVVRRTGIPADRVTTGKNYVSDVARRARIIRDLRPETAPGGQQPLRAGLVTGTAAIGLLIIGYQLRYG